MVKSYDDDGQMRGMVRMREIGMVEMMMGVGVVVKSQVEWSGVESGGAKSEVESSRDKIFILSRRSLHCKVTKAI